MALTDGAHRAFSKRILEHAAETISGLWAANVGLYWPRQREVSLFPLVRRIIDAGGVAALRAPAGRNEPLQFRAWTPGDPLTGDPAGVSFPRDGHRVAPDVLFIALVGFDAANYRLGYGGGSYNWALAPTPRPLAIGVGFEFMRLETVRPRAEDIPMDVIVTEAGAFRRSDLSA